MNYIKKSGIYMIFNIETEKRYYGSSTDLGYRFTEHKHLLNYDKHPCEELQKDWNELGKDNFVFIVVKLTDEKLTEIERNLIEARIDQVYNKNLPKTETQDQVQFKFSQKPDNRGKAIILTKGDEILEFKSIKDAAQTLGLNYKRCQYALAGIVYVRKGVYKRCLSYHGYVFKYKE
jgi:hypothetical protein